MCRACGVSSPIGPCFQLRRGAGARRRWRPPSARPRRARSRSRGSRERAADRRAHAARRREAARQPHAEPGPVHARGVLGHVADRRADDDRAAVGERAHERPVAAVADDDVARAASSASRTATARARRWAARAIGGSGSRPFQVAITRTGSPARPSSAARSSRCSRSCAVEGATSTTGPSPGGGSTFSPGGSHISGPTTRAHDGHSRGYSSCGSVATSVSSRESIVCTYGRGGSPSRAPRLVELVAALLERGLDEARVHARPEARAEPRARQPRADRVDREARRHVRDRRAAPASPPARRPSPPPATAAGVMMSATATSGAIRATISPVSRAALTAAA